MNYSKKFNTTKKAIAEIKRLEKECARLAGQLSNANIILNGEPDIKEIARLKSEIVQFRKTQDYQSDKIGELLEEVEALKHGDALADRMIESKDATIQRLIAQRDSVHETNRDLELNAKQLAGTIIRQANELTDLKAGV